MLYIYLLTFIHRCWLCNL